MNVIRNLYIFLTLSPCFVNSGVSRPLIGETGSCSSPVCTVGDENLKLAVKEVYIDRERLDLGNMVGKGGYSLCVDRPLIILTKCPRIITRARWP